MHESRHPLRTFVRRALVALLALAVLVLLAFAGWVLTHRDEARAWRQTLVAGGALTEAPLPGWVGDPVQPAKVVPAGTLPATVVVPDDGERAHPAVVLVVPSTTSDAELTGVRDAQRALARAGLAAWALRAPGGVRSLGDAAGAARLTAALAAIARDSRTRARRISVAAAGGLASQVLVAAGRAPLRDEIVAVVAAQPVADVQGLVRLAITGRVVDERAREVEHPAGSTLRREAGRAVVRVVRDQVRAPSPLVDALLGAAEASDDPIRALELFPRRLLTPDLQGALDVLHTRDVASFDAAWDELPTSVRSAAAQRSPLADAAEVRARVLLAVPEDDREYPAADTRRLAAKLDDARVVETRLLDPDAPDAADLPRGDVRALLGAAQWWMLAAGA